ncbi:hypothetical protein Sjap_015494 [Stephania japonica]|uniref:Uncharacterized protein n=1 Tax=Stephania japonica TaxID=461633 RepID=A0AAP0IJH6_9MAGN
MIAPERHMVGKSTSVPLVAVKGIIGIRARTRVDTNRTAVERNSGKMGAHRKRRDDGKKEENWKKKKKTKKQMRIIKKKKEKRRAGQKGVQHEDFPGGHPS